MKIRFYVNGGKPQAKAARKTLAAEAKRLGLSVITTGAADVVIALGGDGTMLRAVHELPDQPLLGLNLGGLGYLSSVGESEFAKALHMLAQGRYSVSERAMLEVRRGESIATALNEIAVLNGMTGHAAVLDVESAGRAVTRYMADGLVIATPTGSTAYSLAAGGPVLMPDVRALVMTPLNPHALGARPVVVRDTVRLTVTSRRRVNGKVEPVGVYADGEKAFELGADAAVEIRRAAVTAKLVELDGYDPYEVMSRKLGWSGSNVR